MAVLPLLLALLAAAPPPVAPPVALSPGEIIAAAPLDAWVDIAASDLIVMELAPDRPPASKTGAGGKPRRVVIQLMPSPFSQGWVGNIRKLAAAHWWDGLSVNRVQDNYVAQWGDASEKKPLPGGLAVVPQCDYAVSGREELEKVFEDKGVDAITSAAFGNDDARARYERYWHDPYAQAAAFYHGWPVASSSDTKEKSSYWPVHCYGMVGVGRNMPPDTGTGAELYVVIGHAPRHLDRNIALVGRVVAGIEHLSSLPRGTGALGFYEKAEERVPIRSVRLATELPEGERPRLQYLSTESASFARYADARANRRDPFFIQPAGGADICNIPVPVRKKP